MSLLFYESPILGLISVSAICGAIYSKSNILIGLTVICFICLLFFYRSSTVKLNVSPNVLVSPCEGKIVKIIDKGENIYIAIFMSVFDKHTQIYPADCRVISRVYDATGKFEIVSDLDKSRYNDKKIHKLLLDNGGSVQLTQIAGFIPRAISSSEELTHYKAGDYLGMIKFGSRIDLEISKKSTNGTFSMRVKENDKITLGDIIGEYIE